MKRKLVLSLTFISLFLAVSFALGGGSAFTGFVVSDASQITQTNQVFAGIFLFLALGIFIIGLLHD